MGCSEKHCPWIYKRDYEKHRKKQDRGNMWIMEGQSDPQIPCLKLGREVQVCNHSSGEQETGGSLDLAGQTICPPQSNPVSKSKQAKPEEGCFPKEMPSEVLLWLPQTHQHTHTCKDFKKPWKQFLKTVCGIWGDISHSSCYIFKTIILEMGL